MVMKYTVVFVNNYKPGANKHVEAGINKIHVKVRAKSHKEADDKASEKVYFKTLIKDTAFYEIHEIILKI